MCVCVKISLSATKFGSHAYLTTTYTNLANCATRLNFVAQKMSKLDNDSGKQKTSHENGFGSLELMTTTLDGTQQLASTSTASTITTIPPNQQTASSSSSSSGKLPPLANLQDNNNNSANGRGQPQRHKLSAKRDANVGFRLEICREFLRNSCKRAEVECKFAHPPAHIVAAQSTQFAATQTDRLGNQMFVTVCMDFMNGRCARTNSKCR